LANPYFALVGAQTLLGRDLRDLAAGRGLQLKSFDTADSEGQTLVRDDDGELAILQPIDPQVIAGARAVFLAADEQSSQKVLRMAARHIIDLTHHLENVPAARLAAPAWFASESVRLSVVPTPGALMLAQFLYRASLAAPIARSVATLLVPASEWGTPALTELQQQTTELLTFKPLTKAQFDAQAAFSLLAAFGEESPLKLAPLEARTDQHLVSLLAKLPGAPVPPPSLRLIQAPVFHGLSASVWVQFSGKVDWPGLESTLSGPDLSVHGADLEPPNNVSAAGQDGLSVGAIQRDPHCADAAWFWLVADNHRLVVHCALSIAESLSEPSV
jgi:aspartate-semialdehyde dehydrogenase